MRTEIVLAKHGKLAHKIYTVFGLITNVINGSALLTGGCGVFNALTGMNIWASYFILIVVVEVYMPLWNFYFPLISETDIMASLTRPRRHTL